MTSASGIFKQVAYKVESVFGTAPSASGAQLLRRVSSDLSLKKDTYQSNEIRPDLQVANFRHGVRRAAGKISGELSPKTYADFFGAALKRDLAAITALSSVSLTIAGSGPAYTVTRSAGDFLASGIKVGHVVRLATGSLNAANLNKNLLVVDMTATVLTVIPLNGVALVAEGPITGCGVAVPGKASYIPTTGHTNKSFSIEHYFADLTKSEVFTGCKVSSVNLTLPPTGMATVDFDFMGKDVVTADAQYFTTPTAATTTGSLAAVNGVLRLNGTTYATVTGLNVTIAPAFSGDPVVGSNTIPELFAGKVTVSGQLTAYFDSVALRDAFMNETEIDLMAAFTTDNTATADFIAIALPRIKLGGSDKSDGDGGIVATMPFTALLNTAGGTGVKTEATTVQVQDSAA